MKKLYSSICSLFFLFLSIQISNAQYCVPSTYYGCYYGYMQYTSFSTTGGTANINFAPGGYPNPIAGSNSYPNTCCNVPGEGYAFINTSQCVTTPGTTINFTLHTSNNYPMYYKIWVDYNINGSFNDPGETVYSPSTYQGSNLTLTGSFTVPLNANVGLTRLRIAATYYFYGGSPSPCQTFGTSGEYYGTFTDFNFIISGPCTGVPNALSIATPPILSASCPGLPIVITANEMNYSTGLITKWEQGPTASGPFTYIQGANSLNYSVSVADTTFFIAVDSCTNSSAVSNPSPVYSVPVQKFPLPYIESFSTTPNNSAPSCYVYNDNNGTNFIVQSGLHSPDGTSLKAIYASDPVSNAAYGKNDFFTAPGLSLAANTVYAIRFKYARGKDNPIANTGIAHPEHLQLFVNNYQAGYVVSNVINGIPLFDKTINFDNVGDTTVYFAPLVSGGYYFSWYSNTPHPGGVNSTVPGGVVMVDSIKVNTGTCVSPSVTTQPSGMSSCVGNPLTLSVVAAGTGNYYQWQKNGTNIAGATSQNLTIPSLALSDAGNYQVIISNPCGTVSSATAQLNINALPSASLSPSATVTICSASGYTLNANTNASTAYYLWKLNGNIISSATGSSYIPTITGLYSVAITDGNGCTQTSNTDSINVNQSPPSVITPSCATVFCIGDSVVLFGSTGPGLSNQWYNGSNPIPAATTATFVATASGNYSVHVSNANCTQNSSVQSVSVNNPPPANITTSGPSNLCQGSSLILSANIGVGYSYVWRLNGTPTSIATSNDTISTGGAYSVIVAIGSCATTSTDIVINSVPGPSSSVTPSGTINICSGSSTTLTATSGNGYSYQWLLNGIANSNVAKTQVASTSGNYNVLVTDSSTGCSSLSATAVINQIPLPAASVTPFVATICAGNNISLNAVIANGYTYQWQSNGVNIPGATGATYTDNPGALAIYSVIVTDANNCQNTSAPDSIYVNQPPTASIVAGGNTSFCPGGSVALNANIGANLHYQWQLNGTNISGGILSSYIANSSGFYNVIDTDITTGCYTASAISTVTVNPNPFAQVSANGPVSFCPGYNVVLSAIPSPPGYSYVWLNGNAVVSAGVSYTTNGTGNFRVVVTNNTTSCFDTSAFVTVSLFSTPSNSISASGPTTFCVGSSVVLNTSVTAGISYQWQLNGINIAAATTPSYTANTAGNYAVVLSNGVCSATTLPVTITTNPLPPAIVTASGPTTFCSNQQVGLNANTGNSLTYQWQRDGMNIVGAGSTAASYITDSAGNYTVLVTNANGCTAVSAPPVTININPAPTVTIHTYGSPVSCEGDTVRLYANTGGTTGLYYQWQNNGTNAPWGSFASYNSITSGLYTVIVKSANGCFDTSAGFSVTINPKPQPVISASGPTLSTGSFSTYQWYLGNNAIVNAHSATYTATQTGTYKVFVTDNNYCAGWSTAYDLTSLDVRNSLPIADDIRIYPNPASSILHIDAPVKVNIIIAGLEGKVVLRESNVTDIDLRKIATGMYMARIYSLDGTLLKIEKLLKIGY